MTYDYDRRKVADAEDLHTFIVPVGRMIYGLEQKLKEVEAEPDERVQSLRAQSLAKNAVTLLQRAGARQLFWGLIQQFRMSANDRKIIEQASQEFSKKRPWSPPRGKAMLAFKKKIEDYGQYYRAALRVLTEGKLHDSEGSLTRIQAGPFTLVNAGEFTDQQMEDVKKVVELAASHLKRKGFGKVCYGTIQVTNTVGRNANVLAFYTEHNDELFVRGNLKGKQGPALRTIIHELGHRLHAKFLSDKDRDIRHMYDVIKSGEARLLRDLERDKDKWPKPGATFVEGKKIWVVDIVKLDHRSMEYMVGVRLESDPSRKAGISLKNWFKAKDKVGTFVTPYAATSYSENFAEMFYHYVDGGLPEDQVALLEEVLS